MYEPRDEAGTGFLARLRANETLNRLTRGRPELALIGGTALAALIIAGAVIAIVAMGGGGDGDDEQVSGGTPTAEATAVEATSTPGANAGLKTPIAFSDEDLLSLEDLAKRGSGEPARGPFTGERILIPKIGVDAPFSYKVVPSSGQMPNPDGHSDVAYYDFKDWPGLGGVPDLGGNVVVAGHVDYINHGPAVFWDLATLQPGDIVQIRLQDGRVLEYAIEFNKHIEASDADWTAIVAGTADESITLITCGGEFSAGHYSNRQILWGRRIA
jgi:LPXTG-site transpeptidase (sortase) family protein